VLAFLASLASSGLAAAQATMGPDAAVGSVEERLASAIVFDTTGTFEPGQGFTARVRLSWEGGAGVKSRVVYGGAAPSELPERAFSDARRSAFYNFTVTGARLVPGAGGLGLPAAIEYDVREAMSFGAGRPWTFYVPTPRLMRRLPAGSDLPVAEVGRWTARARYTLADGMFAAAPRGTRVDTDFATYTSSYAVDGRDVVLERVLQARKLALPLEREADLQAFYLAVEDDRRLTFAVTPYAPGGASVADGLNEQGVQALDAGDLPRAADRFREAIAVDPLHRWALSNLAGVQLTMQDAAAAIESSRRALANDPRNPSARLTLGRALEAAGQFDEAEKALVEQVERYPWSAWSLEALARFYGGRQRPADAVRYWQRAVDAAPRAEPETVALGLTLLDLGRPADAVAAWRKGLELASDPFSFNSAAWALAERGVQLDAARDLIQRGLDVLAQNTRRPDPNTRPQARQMITQQFAAMWDTAGWIEFKAGRHENASAWLRAAWCQSEDPVVAEHLGDAFAAARHQDQAARAYADALAIEPGRSSASTKLAAIPGAAAPDAATTAQALRQARTTSLRPGPAAAWTGDLDLTHDRAGAVVGFGGHGAEPAEVRQALREAVVSYQQPPDERPYQFDRRVTVSCPGGNAPCSLVWRPQADGLPR
jgi:tetratricopeptide (TPR) repeat protein